MATVKLICMNCEEEYVEAENTSTSCMWYSETHKGRLEVNEDEDHWDGWHDGNGPKNTAANRVEFSGGFRWSICGCKCGDNGECERIQRHKPQGGELSDDDVQEEVVSDDDSDE